MKCSTQHGFPIHPDCTHLRNEVCALSGVARAHTETCSICRAVAEAEVAAEGVEVAGVGVEEGWADSGQDLVDPVCVPTAGIVHPM